MINNYSKQKLIEKKNDDDFVEELYRLIYGISQKQFHFNEDQIQDVIVKFYDNIENFDEKKSSLSTYVYYICLSIYVTKYRKDNAKKQIHTISLNQQIGEEDLTLLDVIEGSNSAYDKMIEEYDKVIFDNLKSKIYECEEARLFFEEGMPQIEIAKKLNVTPSCVCKKIKKQIYKAKYGKDDEE